MNIEAFWRAVLDQDAQVLARFFAPGAEVRWHCTNECFTAAEYIRANCKYPGEWAGEIERSKRCGETIITAVRVYPRDGSASFHVTSFIRLEGERIAAMDEYWADDGPAPRWRQEMKIGRPIYPPQ